VSAGQHDLMSSGNAEKFDVWCVGTTLTSRTRTRTTSGGGSTGTPTAFARVLWTICARVRVCGRVRCCVRVYVT
jgi:hypothetical protein